MEKFNWSNIPVVEKGPGMLVQTIHTERMTAAHWQFTEGTVLPEHHHPHEQIVMPQEGKLELTVDGEPQVLEAGDVVRVAPNVPHSGRAVTACRVIDLFAPVREDMK